MNNRSRRPQKYKIVKNRRTQKYTIVKNQKSRKNHSKISLEKGNVKFGTKLLKNLNEAEYQNFQSIYLEYFEIIKAESKNKNMDFTNSFTKTLQNDIEDISTKNESVAPLINPSIQQEFNYGGLGGWILSVIVLPGLFMLACYLFFVD